MGQAAGSPTKLQSYSTMSRGTVQSVILVTGATGNASQYVVSQLLCTGAAVLALTRNLDSAGLPGEVAVVRGGLSVPDALDGGDSAPAVFLDAVTKHERCVVCLSSEGVGDGLEQQTDTSAARITAKLDA